MHWIAQTVPAVAAIKSLPSEQLLEDILFIDSDFKIVSKSITL